jgi:hypothetical protein
MSRKAIDAGNESVVTNNASALSQSDDECPLFAPRLIFHRLFFEKRIQAFISAIEATQVVPPF